MTNNGKGMFKEEKKLISIQISDGIIKNYKQVKKNMFEINYFNTKFYCIEKS